MRVLVLAHGDGRRWDVNGQPYMGRPKHFVEADGETLLARQVRLFAERGCDVVVIGPDDRYDVPGATRATIDTLNACGSDMGKFLDVRRLWSTERTVIVWGDCYLTDEVADLVVDHPSDDYHVWRRPGASKVTGARWDESFAVSFGPHEHDRVTAAAEHIAGLVRTGRLKSSHIRTHLAVMAGQPDHLIDNVKHTATVGHQTHIDDWSDDFDTPAEWRGWTGRRYAGTHNVAVCVPWNATTCPYRRRSHDWTARYWAHHNLPVFYGTDTTGGQWPNRSAMRNDAARQAIDAGHDLLLFADADTFIPADQLWAAAHLADERRQLVLAYSTYVRVARHISQRLLRKDPRGVNHRFLVATGSSYSSASHASGALIIPTDLWTAIGGADERFIRWGFEDRALWLAANTLAGVAPRIDGKAIHWWHPGAQDRDRASPEHLEAARLAARYYQAAAWMPDSGAVLKAIEAGQIPPINLPADVTPDPDAMRTILAELGGPLATHLVNT